MKQLTCIICPRGCSLRVDDSLKVDGNACPRGEAWTKQELTHPVRNLTSSVRVSNREDTLVSVKTSKEIDKKYILKLMEYISDVSVLAPTKIGDIVVHNPLGLDTDIVITKKID